MAMPKQQACVKQCLGIESTQSFEMLQLPATALELTLQHLDTPSLACMAVSCSKLPPDVRANMCSLEVTLTSSATHKSYTQWLDRHSSSLSKLTQCSISGVDGSDPHVPYWEAPPCCNLPMPHLRQLRLDDVTVQLGAVAGCPGVLHDCSGLTALDLQECVLEDPHAAFAAIAALPELQSLQIKNFQGPADALALPELLPGRLTKLTQLTIHGNANDIMTPGFLSALVNLESLELSDLGINGIPGGVPFELSKLTRLSLHYIDGCWRGDQFKHLSSLTALRDLSVGGFSWKAGRPPCILDQILHLTHLTSLSLSPFKMEFSTYNTKEWTRLTALESLTLRDCVVEPFALAAFTQLRALYLAPARVKGSAPFLWMHPLEEMLASLSKLSQLTELCWDQDYVFERLPSAGAFTALTASTNLRSLHLQGRWEYLSGGCVLFKPGAVYPHLRCIELQAALCSGTVDDSEQQLQQLCSSCPALEDLSFRLWWDPSPTACLPLLQLSALTHLDVYGLRSEAVNTAAVVDVAAQLTGLQHLKLSGLPQLTCPALLQLTALTALECLDLADKDASMRLFNEERWHNPPDVWIQLLRRLLRDAACREALLEGNSVAPAEHRLARFAISLAEELAAATAPGQQQA